MASAEVEAPKAVVQPGDVDTHPNQPASLDNENKFQKAISAWRNINLESLVTTLDNTASDIVTYQRDSTVQRKDLAQKTKDFRKLEDSAKLGEVKGLLKAYQTFIDLLTNHSKSTNSAFLQVYSSLSEAPDPYPLLEASVDSLLLAEDTLPKISAENEHLQKNVASLTTQLEETEVRLEMEQTARKVLEENLETKVKEVEASWGAVLSEKSDNWTAKEKSLEDKVENQERLLTEIKATYEVSQRMGRNEDDEDASGREHVTSAELEMVTSDLERTSIRLAEVEARNESMRVELAQSASHVSKPQVHVEDDPAYLRLRAENSSLMRKMDVAKIERDAKHRDLEGKLRSVEREIGLLKEERDTLRTKVQKWSDYEDIKQELEVLKSIEFSTGDDDDEDSLTSENGAPKSKNDTLEQLLLARNKKLGDELTILRVSHQDLQSRLNTLEEDMSKTNAELEKAQNLNITLENDLSTVQHEASNNFSSAMSVAGTYKSRHPGVAASTYGGTRGRTSPTSSIISGFNPRDAPAEGMGGGSGILPMITAQRDRFKKRNGELEHELSESHRTVSSLRQEVSSLQKDNLNLYEKTRYVSSYNRGAPTSSASAYASNPNSSTIAMGATSPGGASSIPLDRYRSAYESNISPFAAFRGRESTRAYKRMSLPERIVFSITRMVLATRTSRNIFAAYVFMLHVLVFVSLWWMGMGGDSHVVKASKIAVGGAAAAAARGADVAAKAADAGSNIAKEAGSKFIA